MRKLIFLIVLLIFSHDPSQSWAADGAIKTIEGSVTVSHKSGTESAFLGFPINSGDTIKTGDKSSVGVTLMDGTMLSLGANSRLKVSDYVFDPGKEKFSFLSRISHGTMAYTSGQLAKLAPDAVSVTTPNATIGIRGTRFAIKVDAE